MCFSPNNSHVFYFRSSPHIEERNGIYHNNITFPFKRRECTLSGPVVKNALVSLQCIRQFLRGDVSKDWGLVTNLKLTPESLRDGYTWGKGLEFRLESIGTAQLCQMSNPFSSPILLLSPSEAKIGMRPTPQQSIEV